MSSQEFTVTDVMASEIWKGSLFNCLIKCRTFFAFPSCSHTHLNPYCLSDLHSCPFLPLLYAKTVRYSSLNEWIETLLTSCIQAKVILRPTVSRPVCLGVKRPFGAPRPDFYYPRQLRVCWCGAPSLTRGLVCRLQMLLVLASAVIFPACEI
jgi:hypothetical protein